VENKSSLNKCEEEKKNTEQQQIHAESPKLEANSPVAPVVDMENIREIPSEEASKKNYIDGFEMVDHEETVGDSVIVGKSFSIELKEDHFQ